MKKSYSHYWLEEENTLSQLMPYQIQNILMISSFYDTFVFETDGFLADQIAEDFKLLNLTVLPNIIHCSSMPEIIKYLDPEQNSLNNLVNIDCLIFHISSMRKDAVQMIQNIRSINHTIPLFGLISSQTDLIFLENHQEELKGVDDFYHWSGNSKLFLAIIKHWEDKINFEHDSEKCKIPVILLIETYIPYYSKFLPLLYEKILLLNQNIIRLEHRNLNKTIYMKARPRVMLFHQKEEVQEFITKHPANIIGVITNINYRFKGILEKEAGFGLIERIKNINPELPIIVQSFNPSYKEQIEKLNVTFLYKNIPDLQISIQKWLQEELGFGDFTFKLPDGSKIAKASGLFDFINVLKEIPLISFMHHKQKGHIEAWLKTHGELVLSEIIMNNCNLSDPEACRLSLIFILENLIKFRKNSHIQDWESHSTLTDGMLYRIGSGSIGGKGRGLLFLNVLINANLPLFESFENTEVAVPGAAVIATDEYDDFINRNPILFDTDSLNDEEIDILYNKADLSIQTQNALHRIINTCKEPIAVRSSSVLEDSISNPFAGIFKTFLIPNSHHDAHLRYQQIEQAVKLVYASMIQKNARVYRESLNIPCREEKMAVIIQKIAGSEHGEYFYPSISGVGQSHNYYPSVNMTHTDGISAISSGLGKSTVDREITFSFCPKFPHIDIFKKVEIVANAQRSMYVINRNKKEFDLLEGEFSSIEKIRITEKMKETELSELCSVWDYNELEFLAGSYIKGPRVLTFRPILFYDQYPFAKILNQFLELGKNSMGCEIEMEIAFDIIKSAKVKKCVFHPLQIRPIAVKNIMLSEPIDTLLQKKQNVFLVSHYALGSEINDYIDSIIYISPEHFNRTKTKDMMLELEQLNQYMRDQKRFYILMGPGRWGSSDQFLGIPVNWSQICQAKTIIEVLLPELSIDASHGSHFFHNLFSMNVAYLSVKNKGEEDYINWEWLDNLETEREGKYFKIKKSREKLTILFDGKNSAIFY